jgi:hypothetical protein
MYDHGLMMWLPSTEYLYKRYAILGKIIGIVYPAIEHRTKANPRRSQRSRHDRMAALFRPSKKLGIKPTKVCPVRPARAMHPPSSVDVQFCPSSHNYHNNNYSSLDMDKYVAELDKRLQSLPDDPAALHSQNVIRSVPSNPVDGNQFKEGIMPYRPLSDGWEVFSLSDIPNHVNDYGVNEKLVAGTMDGGVKHSYFAFEPRSATNNNHHNNNSGSFSVSSHSKAKSHQASSPHGHVQCMRLPQLHNSSRDSYEEHLCGANKNADVNRNMSDTDERERAGSSTVDITKVTTVGSASTTYRSRRDVNEVDHNDASRRTPTVHRVRDDEADSTPVKRHGWE